MKYLLTLRKFRTIRKLFDSKEEAEKEYNSANGYNAILTELEHCGRFLIKKHDNFTSVYYNDGRFLGKLKSKEVSEKNIEFELLDDEFIF